MMIPSLTALLSAFLVASAAIVGAAPVVKPVSDLAYNPKITSPKAGDSWLAGSKQTVTWDTTNLPAEVKSYEGKLELGHPSGDSENLDTDNPLASGFKYSDGKVTFTVPKDTVYRDNYEVFLFGDSGNGSPPFSITGGTNPSVL